MQFSRRAFLSCVVASICLLAPLTSFAQGFKRELPSTWPPDKLPQIYRLMDGIKVPKKTFTDATASDVLNFLTLAGESADGRRGISLYAKFPSPMPRITTRWNRLNYRQALDDFCQHADMYWRIEDDAVAVLPDKSLPPAATKPTPDPTQGTPAASPTPAVPGQNPTSSASPL